MAASMKMKTSVEENDIEESVKEKEKL